MFSALVQYFLFPQYSEKAGKLQHMCNRPISLYKTQACVISALHRSPWGSTQNHTLSALLHNQQCLFLLDLFPPFSPFSSPQKALYVTVTLSACSSASHFSFSISQTHWALSSLRLTSRIYMHKQWLSGNYWKMQNVIQQTGQTNNQRHLF